MSLLLQVAVLSVRKTSDHEAMITFKTETSDSVVTAIANPNASLKAAFRTEFALQRGSRLIAEVELSYRGALMYAKVNTFYFFEVESDSTKNTLVGWGSVCSSAQKNQDCKQQGTRMIHLECTTYDALATPKKGSIQIALEIEDGEYAQEYTQGKSIFFTGVCSIL